METHSSILAWRIPWTVHGVAQSRTQSDLAAVAAVGFPGDSDSKETKEGNPGSIPGL